MPLLSRKKVILVKKEASYGTDAAPTGGANAMLVTNFNVSPLVNTEVDRDTMHQYLGQDLAIIAASWCEISFDVEYAGSGTASAAPAWGQLMLACGMSETIGGTTAATYKPVSTAFDSATIWVYIDGVLHKMVGARGTWSLKMKRMGIPYLSFKFTGLYGATVDTALVTPTLSAFSTPFAVNKANTTPVTLHGFAGVFDEISVDMNNDINYRNMIGSESVMLTNRKPTGQAAMEAVLVASLDVFGISKAGTLGTLSVAHGSGAGKVLTLTNTSATQLMKPAYSEQDSVQMITIPMKFIPSSSGNDELQIVQT